MSRDGRLAEEGRSLFRAGLYVAGALAINILSPPPTREGSALARAERSDLVGSPT